MHKTLQYPKVVKNRRVPLRSFSVLWDKTVLKENRDVALLCIKCLDTRYQWSTEGFPWEFFRDCETRSFRSKNVLYPSSPQNSAIPGNSETQKGSLRNFSVLRDQKVLEVSRDIPLLELNFFETRYYWRTEGFPHDFCRDCERRSFGQKIVIFHLSYVKFCDAQSFLEHKCVRLIFSSVLWNKKFSTENWAISVSCAKLTDTRK